MIQDLAAERVVLGGIYNYGEEVYFDIAELLLGETFTDRTNAALFTCLSTLIEKRGIAKPDQASLISIASELHLGWLFEKKEEVEHIRSILASHINKENIRVWAAKLSKLRIARDYIFRLWQAKQTLETVTGSETLEQIIGYVENPILNLSQELATGATTEPVSLGESAINFLEYLEANPSKTVGISTGYPIFDQAIGGGLRRKTVSLIGARSGLGKSQHAANVCLHTASNLNIPTLYLDTEMASEDHQARMLANLTFDSRRVTIDEIERGDFAKLPGQKQSVYQAAKKLEKIPLDYMNVSGRQFEEVVSIMRRWIHKKVGFNNDGQTNPCLIVYDYLKLMSSETISNNLAEYQILGFITTALHNFAVKYDIPILSYIQLNRDGIDRENTSVIAQSDRILWLVTNFSIFKAKSAEEIAQDGPENGNRKIVVCKARHGQGLDGNDYINYFMYGQFGKIQELNTRGMLRNRTVDAGENIPFDQ